METTIIPVGALPTCVSLCGPLFDVNGACAPLGQPRDAAYYDSCFCNDPRLAPFKTGTTGVCDAACTANPPDLSSIQSWFTSYCATVGTQNPTSSPTSGSSNSGGGGGGGSWLDNHYQWVIFLVIMVVAIVGIWIGACIWRRRYLRKKDRAFALGTNVAHATESGRVVPNSDASGSVHVPGAGMFDPAPISSAAVYGEKSPKTKKKWALTGRT